MWKKILWWIENRPDSPLSYSLIVATVISEKLVPEKYYREFKFKTFEDFISDCENKNEIFDSESKVKNEFFSETNVGLDELIGSEILQKVIKCDNINDYINAATFDSQEEIRDLCNKIYCDFLNEPCFLAPIRNIGKIYGQRGISFTIQMQNISKGVDNRDKWAEGTANQFWFGSNAIRCITKRVDELLTVERTNELYIKSVIDLRDAFGFSSLQIEMLKYFVCQSRDGDCPPHRYKAIFIWGDNKGVGKTTIASTIVSILNGEKDISNTRKYESDLPQELGFKDHIAPLICSCRAVLLDEAMPKDSSKSYGSLKKRMTTSGAKVRFVFKNQIDIPAKPNYVFISNDPLETFVQDKSERRFFEFRIEEKKKKLGYQQIYDLFLNFIQQCNRDQDWLEWSDSMAKETEVRGLESRNVDDIKSYFFAKGFYEKVEFYNFEVTIGVFFKHVFDFDKNASKKTIRDCVVSIFGEPYRPSTWRKSDIIEVLDKKRQKDEEENYKEPEKLPF